MARRGVYALRMGWLWKLGLALIVLLLSSASTLLLLTSVVKWLFARRDDEEDSPEADDAPPLEAEPEDGLPSGAVLDYDSAAPPHEPEWDEWEGDPDAPPPNVRPPAPDERVRMLLSTFDPFWAQLVNLRLRDAGIWSFVHGDAHAIGAPGVPATSVHVAEGDLERARQVVAEAEAEAAASRAGRGRA